MVLKQKLSKDKSLLEDAIKKGASVKQDAETESEWTNFCLRMPVKMRDEIESLVKEKVGYKATTWMLQALDNELKRQKAELQ